MNNSSRYEYPIDLAVDSTATKLIKLVGHDRTVLELGCASGTMSRVLRDHGCWIVGVEIDAGAARKSSSFCHRVIVGDLDQLDLAAHLGTETFDVILAADVLEHLRDPGALLLRLQAFLKPQGRIVVSLPNVAHVSVVAALLAGRFDYREIGLLDRTHLRFFTPATAAELLEEAGFEVTATEFTVTGRNEIDADPNWRRLPWLLRYLLKRRKGCDIFQIILEGRLAE